MYGIVLIAMIHSNMISNQLSQHIRFLPRFLSQLSNSLETDDIITSDDIQDVAGVPKITVCLWALCNKGKKLIIEEGIL